VADVFAVSANYKVSPLLVFNIAGKVFGKSKWHVNLILVSLGSIVLLLL